MNSFSPPSHDSIPPPPRLLALDGFLSQPGISREGTLDLGQIPSSEQPSPRTARQKSDYTCELVNRGFKIEFLAKLIYTAPNSSSPKKIYSNMNLYKREKCKHFPVLCFRSNYFVVDQRWIHLH